MTSVLCRRTRFTFARLTSAAAMVAVMLSVAGCGGTTETPPAKDVVPATIVATSADVRGGLAGGPANAPLTVVVKNQAGDPIDSAVVTFAAGSGSGTVANSSVRTNASGEATTTWTLGSTVGDQTATATVSTLAPVTFRAVATVGPATTLTKVAGDAQTAQINTNVATAPSIKLTDALGNPIAGTLVSFTIGSGGGVVNGGAVNTNAEGVATVSSWKLGPAVGANTLVVTAGTLTATFTATGTVGAAATLTLTPHAAQELTVGDTVQLAARVADAAGNIIPAPAVTYATSDAAVAAVSTTGRITAARAGNATITATSGAATASIQVTVIGHPVGAAVFDTLNLGAFPGDVAFTKDHMFAAISGLLQVAVYDLTGATRTGTIALGTGVPILLAPTRAAGPVVAINVGTTSRLWFIDPTAEAITDSVDVNDAIQSAVMTSDGGRIFTLLSNGQMLAFDGETHARLATLSLGGGITHTRIAPGDTLLYALTNVGVIFEIDTRTFATRQIIASAGSTDFAIGQDGLFYLLDATGSVVRLFNIRTGAVVRTVGVSAFATSIALSPDGRQIWLTHSNPAQITTYTGNSTSGFLSTGSFPTTGNSVPIRIYFSPSGSFAAVTNFGGWLDIVH